MRPIPVGIVLLLWAPPLWSAPRLAGTYTRGQWRIGPRGESEVRRLTGLRASAEWLGSRRSAGGSGDLSFRLSAAGRWLRQRTTQSDRRSSWTGALLGGLEGRWWHVTAGLGVVRRALPGGRDDTWRLPAGRLRLGPRDRVYLEASALDLTPWSPGPGLFRLGLGARPGAARLWAGVLSDENERLALGAAAQVPLARGLAMRIGAGVDADTPSRYLVLEVGLGYTFGAPAQPAIEVDDQPLAPGLSPRGRGRGEQQPPPQSPPGTSPY